MKPARPENDAFLSYNRADAPAVQRLAEKLMAAGIKVWQDKSKLIPGEPWQEAIEEGLNRSRTVVIAVGPTGVGRWQNQEMRAALDTRVHDPSYRVIPLLLPGADPQRHPLPPFLSGLTWVDFRSGLDDKNAFARLLAGIQGKPPGPDKVATPTPPAPPPSGGGSGTTYTATLTGSGAIAQGPGSVAAGKGGIAVSGDIKDSTIITGNRNVVGRGRRRVDSDEEEEKE